MSHRNRTNAVSASFEVRTVQGAFFYTFIIDSFIIHPLTERLTDRFVQYVIYSFVRTFGSSLSSSPMDDMPPAGAPSTADDTQSVSQSARDRDGVALLSHIIACSRTSSLRLSLPHSLPFSLAHLFSRSLPNPLTHSLPQHPANWIIASTTSPSSSPTSSKVIPLINLSPSKRNRTKSGFCPNLSQ
eukprot:GHVU01161579.1.p1 GENE.GHVU01161579.1~~GHVU01161579.1.p1  ORF type:complete len:186 (+),score=1.54 GHVU01161579.1:249-806(+)